MNKVEQVHEHIEHGRNEGQTRLDVYRQSMPNSFQITDDCDSRKEVGNRTSARVLPHKLS